MNRFRKEELKKGSDPVENEVIALARSLHAEQFPEEYDFMFDDLVDYRKRQNGENPMSVEYVERVNRKRVGAGLAPLNIAGMPDDNCSWKLAYSEAEAIIKGRISQ